MIIDEMIKKQETFAQCELHDALRCYRDAVLAHSLPIERDATPMYGDITRIIEVTIEILEPLELLVINERRNYTWAATRARRRETAYLFWAALI